MKNTDNAKIHFSTRPHLLWRTIAPGQPLLIDGKLQPELDCLGLPIVRAYTLAADAGVTRLSSGLEIPWPKFRTKREAAAFCAAYTCPTPARLIAA